jgi:stage III sporulation protein AE
MMAHRTAQRLRRFLLAAACCGVIAAFFPFASPASASAAEASAETASPAKAAAGPANALRQMHDLPVDSIERYWNDLLNEYGGYFPERKAPGLTDMLAGGNGFSFADAARGLIRFLFHEILYNGKLLVTIVVITVFGMLLETIQSAFERQAVSKVAYAVSYIVLVIIAVNSFHVAIGYARNAIDSMIHFMVAMVPLLLTLLASLGNVVTVTVLHPLIVFMIHTVGTLIYTIVFPLLFFSAVLHIVSSLTDKYKVTQLANLLRSISVGLLGFVLAVFLGVISVQGATSAAMDGVTIRTAKYIAGNFVPVVGRMLADATDTVMTASLLVKNAIGLAGVIIIVMLCAFPALKIIAMALIYNLSAAVLQPLGDSPIIACLQTIGKSLIYVFAAVAAVGLMFFLAITIMITAGNITVMMR